MLTLLAVLKSVSILYIKSEWVYSKTKNVQMQNKSLTISLQTAAVVEKVYHKADITLAVLCETLRWSTDCRRNCNEQRNVSTSMKELCRLVTGRRSGLVLTATSHSYGNVQNSTTHKIQTLNRLR